MKEDNVALIVSVVGLAITLGFFSFLIILLKKEPTTISSFDKTTSKVYAPQEEKIGKTFLKEPEIGEVDKLSEYTKTEEARPRFPHIINYSIHEANRWYEIKLPKKGVKAWSLRCRDDYNINYCFEPSASTYMTLLSGETLSEDTAPTLAIYVRSPEAVTIEVELWREI